MTKSNKVKRNEEIFRVISRMFAEKGYLETTMRDIARELNIKPPSLYNYFKCKEEALFILVKESMENALKKMENICNSNISAEEKLYRIIEFHTYAYSIKKEGPTLLLNHVDKLSEEHRHILIEEQRRLVNMATEVLEDLIKEGKIKNIPPKIALFAFFGMTNYSLKWYDSKGSVKPEDLTRFFSEIFTKGIMI